MAIQFIRVIIMYALVIAALRLMGKRQIGELQPSELVVTIMVSELASLPMQDMGIPTIIGIIPILTLICLSTLISLLSLKFSRFRRFMTGRAITVVEKGVINQKSLKMLRQTAEDLLEELRLKDVFDINSVIYAQIETNGQLSVLVSPQNNSNQQLGYQYIFIHDGNLRKDIIKERGKSMEWIYSKLKQSNIQSIDDVFLLMADEYENITLLPKDKTR